MIAEKWLRPTAWSASGRPTATATTSCSTPTRRARSGSPAAHAAPADGPRRRRDRANVALADFVAPKGTGIADYVGGFAVTAGIGEEEVAERFERANDDYSEILAKALADRLAEAFAEALHARCAASSGAMRRTRSSATTQLIAEAYPGIRPAPGYPAQPDHTEKGTLFACSTPRRRPGIKLTESYAMWPGRRGVRLLFRPPREPLFRRRQDRAATRSRTMPRARAGPAEAERWLAPILNYDPGASPRRRPSAGQAKPLRPSKTECCEGTARRPRSSRG